MEVPNLSKYLKVNEQHALGLVMTYEEFLARFVKVENLHTQPNTPIAKLLKNYEQEHCDHANMEWVARTAQRYVQTMRDSQVRCLLDVLSRHVLKDTPYKMLGNNFSCSYSRGSVK